MIVTTEIIRKAFPGASAEFCEHVLWNRTPFPMGVITAKSIYQAASRLRRAGQNGLQLCDFCDRVVRPGQWNCDACEASLYPVAS